MSFYLFFLFPSIFIYILKITNNKSEHEIHIYFPVIFHVKMFMIVFNHV
jgi:hypothetical protein